MKSANLTLHCGASKVERVDVEIVRTPEATKSWTPIPHIDLVERIEGIVRANGLVIGNQAHSLTKDGDRYFGLMEIQRAESQDEYCWVFGIRNSHDKKFPAGLVAGSSVFVCDNLSFSGEVKLARKHTTHIMRDLPALAQAAVGQLMEKWTSQDKRIAAYKQFDLADAQAHDILVRAVDAKVCPNAMIPKVLEQWRDPKHEAFAERNAWSLFNGFTEVLKEGSLMELPARSIALHGLLDNVVGLAEAK